jgi:hypothetical protein
VGLLLYSALAAANLRLIRAFLPLPPDHFIGEVIPAENRIGFVTRNLPGHVPRNTSPNQVSDCRAAEIVQQHLYFSRFTHFRPRSPEIFQGLPSFLVNTGSLGFLSFMHSTISGKTSSVITPMRRPDVAQ